METNLSFPDVIRIILKDHPLGLTPQEIREIVKSSYPLYYGTESHHRNVLNGNYKDLDHALLARIYIGCRNARDIFVDKTQKPHRMSLEVAAEPSEFEAEESIEGESLEKLANDVGTLYVLGTNLFTADGMEIIKIGITTGAIERRITQLYTTGVPFRFRVISQLETSNYSKLEQGLHCLFDRYRINKAREFFTSECLEHIDDLIHIHNKIERSRLKP
ncbi:GIY-YIG nuclease family protein [Stutzerimonas zhaodongensis]|uniref:GIY-YIG nuclease family protein n=1 Tax=Stutzerimonas zhaodongensis TaxID=1176257 RepID=A0A3M2HZM4_9GAMM|nr:GIY-YIG nuclease family protein [Stutzerimonas zhaodongensis]MCQ4314908.1 GIY-YIG nuclease family protein [Stutzerimonas zhaodongensis]RMH92402.1 GIY-YIG nuclease family protein [Stutzerimonas zhaodongensis]